MTVMVSETEIPLLRGDIALPSLSTTLALSKLESDKERSTGAASPHNERVNKDRSDRTAQ